MKVVHSPINISFDDGGAGDCFARLPAIQWMYEEHKHLQVHLWVPAFFKEVARACLPKDVVVRDFTQFKKYNRSFLSKAFTAHKTTNLACHMTDHAFFILGNSQVDAHYKNYLRPDLSSVVLPTLPEKFVVVTTGYTSAVREWLPEHVNAVVQYVKSKGYAVVFLGKTTIPNGTGYAIQSTFSEEIDFSQGLNLVNSTSLLEAIAIMGRASAVVGLDNGLLHAAACTDVPIVGGFTSVLPQHRMPYRHDQMGWGFYPVTLTKAELGCIGCQSTQVFTFNHSFLTCLKDPTAKSAAIDCVKMLGAKKYITELEKIL